MNVAFLFPGSDKFEALDNWVSTVARYAWPFAVYLARTPADCTVADVVFLLTEARTYPKIDADIVSLKSMGKPFGVVHNNDNPGVPTPGDYPSFCWTEQALSRLAPWKPVLVRQPVLPFIMQPKQRPLHIGTFGHIERKKSTLDIARWAKANGSPFTAFCPDTLVDQNRLYITGVRSNGATIVQHPWRENIEDLGPLFSAISHFLFVLPKSKGGTGGSPTSPRYATAFARPVVVVDDEPLLTQDGIYVFDSLEAVTGLDEMKLPSTAWGSEQYIAELVKLTLTWRRE